MSENHVRPVLTALNYNLSREGDKIIVYCPDLDISSDGRTTEETESRLNVLVLYQINQW